MAMQTLNEKFISTCLDFTDREAMRVRITSGWSVYKYRDLLNQARKIAFWLQTQGFQKQGKAAIILDNNPQWSFVYFGILLSGGVCVPLDPQASRQDIVTFIEDSGAEFVFMENRLLESLQHHLRGVKKIIILKREKTASHCTSLDEVIGFSSKVADIPLIRVDLDDTASIIYSSGTTSNPKGIELSHRNLYANFESINELKVCSSEDNFISILPLFHAYAFMATLLYPVFIGARIAYPKTIKSAELVQVINDVGVTIVVGVPELFNTIHKSISERVNALPLSQRALLNIITDIAWRLRRLTGINILKLIYKSVHEKFGEHLRLLVSGGARLDPKIGSDFEKFGFTILEGYGLSETAPLVTFNPPQKIKIGSVGKPVLGVEVKIINSNPQGVGEIIIRGANVMKGYYQKPEETKEVIKEGWFYSGDLGHLDHEGYLYINGRLKEVIVLGSGKNIFPEEVEKYYNRSKYIKEMGVFLAGQEAGGNLKSVVVPNFEAFKKSGQINIEEKIRWDMENISKELASYKRIMGFVLSKEELPKTRLGKIKRYMLPSIFMKESIQLSQEKTGVVTNEEGRASSNPLGRRVVDFLKTELKFSRAINVNDHLELDLGVDSLTRVELIAALEKLFQISLSDETLREVATVSDLIARIDEAVRFSVSEGYQNDDAARASWHDMLNFNLDNRQFDNIELDSTLSRKVIGYLLKGLILFKFKIFCRLKVMGKENLPKYGPYILCCNHSSYLDAFVLLSGLSNQTALETYFVGLKEIFDHPALRWSIRFARVIPIDPTTELVRAMQAASFVLRRNKILCIFPEGQRSIDGEIKRFKKGIGIIAKELDAIIIPVAIEGAYQAWPRTATFPKSFPIEIIFGKPVHYRDLVTSEVSGADDEYKLIADKLREEVIALRDKLRE